MENGELWGSWQHLCLEDGLNTCYIDKQQRESMEKPKWWFISSVSCEWDVKSYTTYKVRGKNTKMQQTDSLRFCRILPWSSKVSANSSVSCFLCQLKLMAYPVHSMGECTSMVRTSSPFASTSAPAWMVWWAACPSVPTKCPCLGGDAQSPGWRSPRVAVVKNGCVMMTTASARSWVSQQRASCTQTTSVLCCQSSDRIPSQLPAEQIHSEVKLKIL